MSSKIEQIIEEIEEYIDGCKPQTLSKTNIVVNKEEIEELLRELRMKTPEEIRRYQKVLANRDAILADAQAKAEAIIKEANIHTSELVNEHEIMQPMKLWRLRRQRPRDAWIRPPWRPTTTACRPCATRMICWATCRT